MATRTCTFVTPRGGKRTATFTDRQDLDEVLTVLGNGHCASNGVLYRGSHCYTTAALCETLDPKTAMYPYDMVSPRQRSVSNLLHRAAAFGSGVTFTASGITALYWMGCLPPTPWLALLVLCGGLAAVGCDVTHAVGPVAPVVACLGLLVSRLWAAASTDMGVAACRHLPLAWQVRLCSRTPEIVSHIQFYCARHPLRDVLDAQPLVCESVLRNETSHVVSWTAALGVALCIHQTFGRAWAVVGGAGALLFFSASIPASAP